MVENINYEMTIFLRNSKHNEVNFVSTNLSLPWQKLSRLFLLVIYKPYYKPYYLVLGGILDMICNLNFKSLKGRVACDNQSGC